MPAKLIQVTQRKEDSDFCEQLANKIQFEMVIFTDSAQLESVLVESPQAIVVYDVDHPDVLNPKSPYAIQSVLPVISRHLPPSRVFALADTNLFELPQLSRILAIGHYCVRQFDPFGLDWVSKIAVPLFGSDPFNLRYYIDPDAKLAKLSVKRSKDKTAVLNGLANLLSQKQVPERCLNVIVQAVDEVLMNAIFNAPIDAKGLYYRKNVDRNQDFEMNAQEAVDATIVLNQESVVVCIQDHFGSFTLNNAMKAIQKDYSTIGYRADPQTQSAGLGLHGIVASGLGMIVNVDSNKSTQAILSFPYFKNFKGMRQSFRSFSLNIR